MLEGDVILISGECVTKRLDKACVHLVGTPIIQPVILAGGSGTRLWPVSRSSHYPKQLLTLLSARSMLQETVLRVADSRFAAPLVLCSEQHRFLVAEQLRAVDVKPAVIVLEPECRNTAPAVAVASLLAQPEAILLIMPADHVILHKERFHAAVMVGITAALRGKLVVFGIKPEQAETGYGYIRQGKMQDGTPGVYSVESFVEKPDLATARKFLAEGDYLWNSGIFSFQAWRYLEELNHFRPRITETCRMTLEKASHDSDFCRLSSQVFLTVPSESVDCAVMEHTSSAAVVPADMGWYDIGSWSSMWDVSPKDANGNVLRGDTIAIDSFSSYVYSEEMLTAVVGVQDMIVIVTDDACLVASMNNVQQIRLVIDHLQHQQRPECVTRRATRN